MIEHRRGVVALIAALGGLAVAGCGGGGDSGASVEDAAQGFIDAEASGDWAAACAYYSDKQISEGYGSTAACEAGLSKAAEQAGPDAQAQLENVVVAGSAPGGVEGETIVKLTLNGQDFNELHFVQVDGEWKIQGS